MTTSLTPELALAYVRELSADFRAGIVLDAGGTPVAGDQRLTEPARALLRAHPFARELHVISDRDLGPGTAGAQVFVQRGDELVMVVLTTWAALPGPIRRDVRTALSGTGAQSAQEIPSGPADAALVTALVTAVADAFRR